VNAADAGRQAAAAAARREAGRALENAVRAAGAHAERVLARGGPPALVCLVESLPEESRTDALREVYGEALALAGDAVGARVQYRRLAGGSNPHLPPSLARRLGFLELRAGDPRAALCVFARGIGGEGQRGDHALLTAWISFAHWAAGEAKDAADAAEQAHRAASDAGEYRAAIAARVALGLTAEVREGGATPQGHYTAALEIAVANGDAIREAAVRAAYAGFLLGKGRTAEALTTAERSVSLAEATGLHTLLGAALTLAGSALRRLGRLDEALERLSRAVAAETRTGSSWRAYPLVGIGNVHRVRGSAQAACAAYEEAARVAAEGGDRHVLVSALAGQALVLAEREPTAAAHAAGQALHHAEGRMRAEALLALGHAVHGAGDALGAARIAQESAGQARLYGDRFQLARALELSAATAMQPRAVRRALGEALRIWQEVGAVPDADRVRAVLAARADASTAVRVAGRRARERLSAAGIAAPGRPANALGAGEVEIRTLGRLTVLIDGEPVSAAAWQSRKARGLLRILVARRGRAVPREQIAHLLWGDAAGPVGHRLSVALSTVRSVLDPDRRHGADYFIVSDSGSVALDTRRVTVDVERFLAEAERGLRLHEAGELAQALDVLTATQSTYTGDFLEDEPYDDWTIAVRETARATYLHGARVLVGLHRGLGDTAGALRGLYRILDKDPYDERCHREIIEMLETAGAHGEARRARERYTAAMRSLNLEDW
jgi:DNA-binding SARP family transcriptional activator/tetratricopeptide (TPR) repeat protein